MQRRIRSFAAVAGIAVIAVLAGCAGTAAPTPTAAKSIVIAPNYGTSLTTFDNCNNSNTECQPVFETLLRAVDTRLDSAEPLLAESVAWNDDRTVLSVTLRDNVKFSNGEVMDAAAVEKSWDYLMTTFWKDVWYSTVTSFDVTGDLTFEFHLSAPDNAFLDKLTNVPMIIAPDALADTTKLATTPIGTGPYLLDSASTTSDKFVRNPDYWGGADAYYYDSIEVRAYPDSTARLNAILSGQLDWGDIDPSAADQAKATPGISVYPVSATTASLIVLDMNGETTPALGDIRVRQALQMAFDRASIVKNLLNGWGDVTTQSYKAPWPEYDKAFDSQFPYDPAKAKQLLADAGYADGFDLAIPQGSDDPSLPLYAPIIQQSLADIGVRVTFDVYDSSQISDYLGQKKYSVGWRNLAASTFLDYVSGPGLNNPYDWTAKRPDIQKLVDAVQADPSDEAAGKALGAALFNEGLILTLAGNQTVFATSDNVSAQNITGQWYRQLFEIQPPK